MISHDYEYIVAKRRTRTLFSFAFEVANFIHFMKTILTVACSLLFISGFVAAQSLEPAPDLRLLSSGYGAAALGMGGAFTAVADDLSAIYWNPAGPSQNTGMQFFVDYSFSSDSDEDFAAEVQPNTFQSPQRYSLSGNRFNSFAFSYTFETKSHRFTPLVAWHRTSYLAPERSLKEPAGFMEFETQQVFFQSEGLFKEKIDGGENEWAVGMSAMVSKNVLFGGTLNFLTGNPETHLTGTFHDSLNNERGTTLTDVTLDQKTREELSGSYFKVGLLFFPGGPVRLGGTMRFPYTRSSTLKLDRGGSAVTDGESFPISAQASAKTEVDQPLEWSVGAAILRSGAILSASVTYSDWSDVQRVVRNSTDANLIPEESLLYPSLRDGALQTSLLQYRVGTEYTPGSKGSGLVLRAGYFWDGQPYGGSQREYFDGYSFGGGYMTRTFRIDGTYTRESGNPHLTVFSDGDSHISHRRFLISLTLLGQ